jgi:hypothetical protein
VVWRRFCTSVSVAALLCAASGTAANAAETPKRLIVVLRNPKDASAVASVAGASGARLFGARLFGARRRVVTGFAVNASPEQARTLASDPRVRFLEEDRKVSIDSVQANPVWNLDRVDQSDRPLDGAYTYGPSGAGVNVYVIDTGIRVTHQEFGGRASVSFDAVGDGQNGNDCNGHGTHVAGTIAGTTYGVAKSANVHAVRVLGCDGSGWTSDVIQGIDWVTSNHAGPSVANMSLGGDSSSAVKLAVANSVSSGVTYAVAAGNDHADACAHSPANEPSAITVAASDSEDTQASFSNYGTCVDIFAPGVSVISASNASDTAARTLSGTSMATPHVAGAAAVYLSAHTSARPADVASALTGTASAGKIQGISAQTPNLLLFTGHYDQAPPPPPPAPAPSASPSPSASASPSPSPSQEPASQTFTLTVAGPRGGVVRSTPAGIDCGATCAAEFTPDAAPVLQAIPASHYKFTGWSGDCSGLASCAPSMDQARNVSATFAVASYLLTVSRSGRGTGTVTTSGISCGSHCQTYVATNRVVTMSVRAGAHSVFAGWVGACSGKGICRIAMTRARSVRAVFNRA